MEVPTVQSTYGIHIHADVASRREKIVALRAFVEDVLRAHDPTFRVDIESETLTVEDLFQMDAARLSAIAGTPVRYAFITPVASATPGGTSAGFDFSGNRSLTGAPRRTSHRFEVQVWMEEEPGSYDLWESATEDGDADSPGLVTALHALRGLAVTTYASGVAARYVALCGDVENQTEYRGAFGIQSVEAHYTRFQITLT